LDRDPNWKRRMSKAYLALHREVSAALYEEDPEGFGATIGSPADEYDTEAARVIAALSKMEGDVRTALDSMLTRPTKRLVERIAKAWHETEGRRLATSHPGFALNAPN